MTSERNLVTHTIPDLDAVVMKDDINNGLNHTKKELLLNNSSDNIYGQIEPEHRDLFDQTVFAPTLIELRVGSKSNKGMGIKMGEPGLTESLLETSRLIADTQNEMGINSGLWNKGRVLQFDKYYFHGAKAVAYTYMTNDEIEAAPIVADVVERKYTPTTVDSTQDALTDLFPSSARVMNVAKSFLGYESSNKIQEEYELSDDIATVIHSHFIGAEEVPFGNLSIVVIDNLPVLVTDDKRDIDRFKPYPETTLPSNTTAISFVVTPNSIGRGSIFNDTIFVMCMKGTNQEDLKQHIRSQIAYRKSTPKLKDVNPVFVTESPITREEHIDQVVKQYVLSFVVRHDENINWNNKVSIIDNITKNSNSGMFIAENTLTTSLIKHILMENSPYYLGHVLKKKDIYFDNTKEFKKLEDEVVIRLKHALNIFSYMAIQKPSREFQLITSNYLSRFPLSEWENAYEKFDEWDKKQNFINSFGIKRVYQRKLNQGS